jgi:hypothetical protein
LWPPAEGGYIVAARVQEVVLHEIGEDIGRRAVGSADGVAAFAFGTGWRGALALEDYSAPVDSSLVGILD